MGIFRGFDGEILRIFCGFEGESGDLLELVNFCFENLQFFDWLVGDDFCWFNKKKGDFCWDLLVEESTEREFCCDFWLLAMGG